MPQIHICVAVITDRPDFGFIVIIFHLRPPVQFCAFKGMGASHLLCVCFVITILPEVAENFGTRACVEDFVPIMHRVSAPYQM